MKPNTSLRISALEIQRIMNDTPQFMVMDVRGIQNSPKITTIIPGAAVLSPTEFPAIFQDWDRNKWYFLYCA